MPQAFLLAWREIQVWPSPHFDSARFRRTVQEISLELRPSMGGFVFMSVPWGEKSQFPPVSGLM